MKPFRSRYAVLTAAAAAAALALAVVPAQAAATGWSVVLTKHYGPATNYSAYYAVVAPSANDAWAFGTTNGAGEPAPGTPVAEHWNGTKWRNSPLPSGLSSEIDAASAVSARSVWAVTEVGGDILHWNGSTWSVSDDVPGSDLLFTGITAVSNSDVWAFGSSSVGPGLGTWHYNGDSWTQVNGSAVGLVSASALSAKNIWALGSSSEGPAGDLIEHYNGTTWEPVTASVLSGVQFAGIVALSSTNVWAIGGNGIGGSGAKSELVHFNGSQWTSVTVPYSRVLLNYFAPDGQGGFWLDASHGTSKTWVLHYSAAGTWSRATLTGSMGPLALVPGTTSLWGVGAAATPTPASNARVWAYSQTG